MGRQSLDESRIRIAILSAAIFIVALFVRLMPLGLYVTPDEPIWVMRSVAFLQAVEAGDWADVPQTGHPGITTMALGALGVKTMAWLQPGATAVHRDWIANMAWLAPENAEAFEHLAYFLPAGRLLVAVVTSAGLAWAYQLGRRRLGARTSRWMALLLALDPFLAGHSGLLHTDALQATFALLAVLLVLPREYPRAELDPAPYIRSRRIRRPMLLILAALCLALSGLTKTLGLLVAPGLAFAVLLWGEGTLQQRSVQVISIAALTAIFLLMLYPPFWVAPRAALNSLFGAITYHEGIGLRSVFFLGKLRTDPGPAFYPLVLFFRMTPPVLLGLAGALFGVSRSRRRAADGGAADGDARRFLRWGALVALPYLVALTLAAKKFDRYILTVIPLLTPAAASAWSRAKRGWRWVALGLLLLPWALVAIVPLHYASPLLGGPWGAQAVIPLGWGEASGFAARKLNRLLPAPEAATVLTENIAGTAPFFSGETWPRTVSTVGCTDAIIGQRSSAAEGYAVAARLRLAGREVATIYTAVPAEPPSLPLLSAGPLPGLSATAVPEGATSDDLVAWLNATIDPETSFLWVHPPLCYPLAEAQLETLFAAGEEAGRLVCEPASPVAGFEAEQCRLFTTMRTSEPYLARFAGAVDLVSVAWDEPVQALDPLTVHLRWLPHTTLGELDIYLALQTGDGAREIIWADGGQRVVNGWGWAAPEWLTGTVTDGEAYVAIPLDLPPGIYTLVMSLSGSDGWLGLTRSDGSFGGTQLVLGDVVVEAPPYPAPQLARLIARDAKWPGLHVIGVEPPEMPLMAGRAMQFSLGLERREGPSADALAWGLVCGAAQESRTGVRRSQLGLLQWVPSTPEVWPVGHRYEVKYAPLLPPDLPEGKCTLAVWPAYGDGLLADSARPGADAVIVGEVFVQQRSRDFVMPRIPDIPLAVTVEGFGELVGADLAALELRPGDDLNVTLYWRVLGPAEADYTVFVHLVDPGNGILAQSDAWPDGGAAPTTTWSAGEIVVDRHVLWVPEAMPAGEYELYAGMYDAKRGTRQVLYAAGVRLDEDRAQFSLIEIQP